MSLSLKAYCEKFDLTYKQVAQMIKRPVRTVSYWGAQGYQVKTNGKQPLEIKAPERVVWSSEL